MFFLKETATYLKWLKILIMEVSVCVCILKLTFEVYFIPILYLGIRDRLFFYRVVGIGGIWRSVIWNLNGPFPNYLLKESWKLESCFKQIFTQKNENSEIRLILVAARPERVVVVHLSAYSSSEMIKARTASFESSSESAGGHLSCIHYQFLLDLLNCFHFNCLLAWPDPLLYPSSALPVLRVFICKECPIIAFTSSFLLLFWCCFNTS